MLLMESWKEIRCYDNFLFNDLDKPPPDGQAYDGSSGPPKGWLGFFNFFFIQPKTDNDLIAKTRKERRAPDQQRHHAEELIGHGGA